MAYNVRFKRSVEHDLRRIPIQDAKHVLDSIDDDLPLQAGTYPALKGKFSGMRKMRVGDYRVIFTVIGNDVVVLKISHRKDAYQK